MLRNMRWFYIGSAVMLIALVFAACGTPVPPPQEIPEPPAPPAETPELPPPPQAPEVVTFMAWAADPFEEQALNQIVQQFNEAHPAIHVELIIVR